MQTAACLAGKFAAFVRGDSGNSVTVLAPYFVWVQIDFTPANPTHMARAWKLPGNLYVPLASRFAATELRVSHD